jgi:malate dehydrogenase (oxaloacetate-decarboxylating)
VNWQGRHAPIDQTNNSYIFPGLGLGVLAVNARRVTDTMFMAAARCLAELSPARSSKSGRLLPPVSELRTVSFAVAKAVALQAIADGVADPLGSHTMESRLCAHVWQPMYLPYRFCPAE